MARRRRTKGSENRLADRKVKLTRRALIGGLGGGLAVSTLGLSDRGLPKKPPFGSVTADKTPGTPRPFAPDRVQKIEVTANRLVVYYQDDGQDEIKPYRIDVPSNLELTLDMQQKRFLINCLLLATPASPPH